MGCYERTLAWLIEKYAGKFPTWLCPEQVRVLPISEKYEAYAGKVLDALRAKDIDATVDNRSEKIGFKIREARLAKIPYMLVVGQQEDESGAVLPAMRDRSRYKVLWNKSVRKFARKRFARRLCRKRVNEIAKKFAQEICNPFPQKSK